MNFKKSFLLVAVLLIVAAVPAVAQSDLPPTAGEGVQMVAVFLATLAGLLSTAVVDAVKKATWIREEDKSAISGPMADLVAAVVSIGSGYLISLLGQWAGVLDESGIWQVILFAWPTAKAWYEVTARRRAQETATIELAEIEEVNVVNDPTRH